MLPRVKAGRQRRGHGGPTPQEIGACRRPSSTEDGGMYNTEAHGGTTERHQTGEVAHG
jgi:hypothetical protein